MKRFIALLIALVLCISLQCSPGPAFADTNSYIMGVVASTAGGGCTGSGFTLIDSATNSNSGSGTQLSTDAFVIASGDLLVVFVAWEDGSSTMSVSDGGSNNLTMTAVNEDGSNYGVFGYKIGATASGESYFTATWGTARPYRSISVYQFRPDSGETVTLDVSDLTYNSTGPSMTSGEVTTTGCDEVVLGAAKNYGGWVFENEQIAGAAANGALRPDSVAGMWYSVFSETKTSIAATATAATNPYVCSIISFKSQ